MTKHEFKPYCLRCYAPLGSSRSMCSACGFSNPISIRQKYWTREPILLRVESVLKISIVVFVPVSLLVIIFAVPGRRYEIAWLLAVPFFLAFPLWMTASRLTARGGIFSGPVFWTAVLVLSALVVGCKEVWFATIPLGLIGLIWAYAAAFHRWKRMRIQRGGTQVIPEEWPGPAGSSP